MLPHPTLEDWGVLKGKVDCNTVDIVNRDLPLYDRCMMYCEASTFFAPTSAPKDVQEE